MKHKPNQLDVHVVKILSTTEFDIIETEKGDKFPYVINKTFDGKVCSCGAKE